ncbi:MAG: PQQ-dependent sugar dehydrogenase [Chloroflexi bacterium]|nr:PQQ-dependent sugar dehydrogenase [Chloroflexota bacterium]
MLHPRHQPRLKFVVAIAAGIAVACAGPSASPTRVPVTSGAASPSGPTTSGGSFPSASTPAAPGTTGTGSATPATGEPSGLPTSSEPGASGEPTPSAPVSQPPASARLAALQLTLEPFATGLDAPVFIGHAGDGSGTVYIVEQAGRVRTASADGTVADTPFIDLSERISAGGEQGLLGLAFHPEFPENGRFFVDYTNLDGDHQISEFRIGADGRGDPSSERKLIFLDDFAGNHNGGMLAFGPDGHLYIAMGDGGGAGDPRRTGQDRNVLFGKILRIAVDADGDRPYGIPADNPFVSGGGSPEIYDYGLRNPWRFSFDRATKDLWIADVGQGEYEEVDLHAAGVPGGLNFGWRVMEGPDCFEAPDCDATGKTLPVASYTHAEGGCSISGGYVYRGEAWQMLEGIYLYGDYCSGIVWGLDAEGAGQGPVEPRKLLETGERISSFGEDESGELYLVSLGGSIFRVTGR